MKTSTEIIQLIKSFDYSYAMSDDSRYYDKGLRQESEIIAELKEASNDTIIEVRDSIDLTNIFLSVPFGEYFEGITEPKTEAKPKSKLSEIMAKAWEMFKAELFQSFAEALKASWKRFKLVQLLKQGIARFTFIKSNGEAREAIGTLRTGNFQYETKGTARKPSPANVIKYYDIVSNAWRSCRVDRLTEVAA